MSKKFCVSDTVSPFNNVCISKAERYGWSFKDEPGEFMLLPKNELNVDHAYQRDNVYVKKVNKIASEWSWAGCGCLSVAMRRDNSFWVFDGQHRVLAAKKRSDIHELPCMVFLSEDVEKEAKGFLNANAERRPVNALDKFKALVMTGDKTAITVFDIMKRLDIDVNSHAISARQLKCVSKCQVLARKDPKVFEWALEATLQICGDSPVHRDILDGLFWIENKYQLRRNKQFAEAVANASRSDILDSIAKYAAAEGKRGDKVCGIGTLKVLNRKRRNRFGDD